MQRNSRMRWRLAAVGALAALAAPLAAVAAGSGPTTSIAVEPTSPNGQNGWYVSDVTVEVTASGGSGDGSLQIGCTLDSGSYINVLYGCSFAPSGLVSADGQHQVYAAAGFVDAREGVKVNNQGETVGLSFKIDKTKPTLSCALDEAVFFQNQRAPAEVAARGGDATSGPSLIVVTAPADVSSTGQRAVDLKAADNAGNEQAVRCAYRVLANPGGCRLEPTGSFDSVRVGTSGNDRIAGGPGRDLIVAGAGDDAIDARDGNDVVCAGPGNDVVRASAGNDTVDGGPGADAVAGGAGSDSCLRAETALSCRR